MPAKLQSHNDHRLLSNNIAEVASILSDEGREFNQHLTTQFEGWKTIDVSGLAGAPTIASEHLVFCQAIAQALQWIQQVPVRKKGKGGARDILSSVPVIYLRVMLEAKSGLLKEPGKRLEQLLALGEKEEGTRRPRRLSAVVAGLETWANVELPRADARGNLDLEEIQRLALRAGGRARWTVLAPIKMYCLHKGPGFRTPRVIFPPMGRRVSIGINRLLGFDLGESEADYTVSRGLHLKLADLANSSIWDVNSGFYVLGGGS